jgi:hypothetical protein
MSDRGRASALVIGLCLASCSDHVSDPSPPNANAGSSGSGSSGSGGAAGSAGSSALPASGGSGNASGGSSAGSSGASGGPTSGGGGNSGGGGAGGSSTGGSTSSESATIRPDPSWTCGAAEGVPPPTQGELVFTATLEIGETHEFGATPYGVRRLLDVNGATFSGDKIQGTFLTGGLELELELENGATELEGINVLRTDDGVLIYLRSCGFSAPNDSTGRVVPDFEVASSSAYSWLNDGKYAATRTVNEVDGSLELAVYDISGVEPGEPEIVLVDPAGVPHQPVDCSTQTGTKGASVFTENVTLGSSLSIGASKRGSRNIIPITGGTVSGSFTGSVLPGGADYQLIGQSTVLDARYTLVSDDGDYVLVRNCGPFGALVPLFEARKDGPLAFLNTNEFLSSDPGSGAGGVSITFYERQ